ncbi:peptidase E [Streptomyces sp. NPDC006172]|uniref:Type 1 glutamine amidotransferase-like domain-containing protein n=1 Tax=Streptomyces sp. NPDC006172 TaxID=3154470 RepID=UPI0034083E8F
MPLHDVPLHDVPRRVALLGGGFSSDSDGVLDDWMLGLARRPRPKVCFMPTASGDAEGYAERFLAAFDGRECEPSVLRLFRREVDDASLRAFVLAQDVVYVGGGNTANLLAVWRVHGVDRLLVEAYERGTLLCGISAGANCWARGSHTDSFGPLTFLPDGLGLLPGSVCPHKGLSGVSRRPPEGRVSRRLVRAIARRRSARVAEPRGCFGNAASVRARRRETGGKLLTGPTTASRAAGRPTGGRWRAAICPRGGRWTTGRAPCSPTGS